MSAVRGVDHLVIAVSDLDAAMGRYGSMGFTTTPRALHPWGTGNSLVQLERNFLEILSVEKPEQIEPAGEGAFSFGDFNRRFLQHQRGMSMLVFSSDDSAADLAHWKSRGLTIYEPFHFSRTAILPDGTQVKVAFSLAFVTHPEMPGAAWFVCQQHHPENFWRPRFQQHANGAQRLRTVLMAAGEPRRYADFLGSLFAEGEVREEDGGVCLQLPDGEVALHTPSRMQAVLPGMDPDIAAQGPRFVAATVQVSDLAEVERCLREGAVASVRNGSGVWVPAAENEGMALGFRCV